MNTAAPTPTEKGADDSPPPPPVTDRTKRWEEAADKLRSRVDLTAKALGGFGTSALTAVGIARIGDLFPVSDGWGIWIWFSLAVGGFVALAVAVLTITYRLWKVNQPISMRTDTDVMVALRDIDTEEQVGVDRLFDMTARLNGASSLQAYEARAHQLSRIAARTADATTKQKLESDAAEIEADIRETFARVVLRLLRRRTNNAVRGLASIFAYALLVSGILLFALGSDYIVSERTDKVEIAKACADARKAGADEGKLPRICGDGKSDGGSTSEATPTSAAQEQAKAAASTVQSLERCLALIDAKKATAGSCDTIAKAAQALLEANP